MTTGDAHYAPMIIMGGIELQGGDPRWSLGGCTASIDLAWHCRARTRSFRVRAATMAHPQPPAGSPCVTRARPTQLETHPPGV